MRTTVKWTPNILFSCLSGYLSADILDIYPKWVNILGNLLQNAKECGPWEMSGSGHGLDHKV
jgi:hypothetical protein